MSNILLVNDNVQDYQIIINACNDITYAITYNQQTDTYDTIFTKYQELVSENNIQVLNHLALVSHGSLSPEFTFLDRENKMLISQYLEDIPTSPSENVENVENEISVIDDPTVEEDILPSEEEEAARVAAEAEDARLIAAAENELFIDEAEEDRVASPEPAELLPHPEDISSESSSDSTNNFIINNLDTWNVFKDFIKKFNIQESLDFLGCAILLSSDWKYTLETLETEQHLNLNIRASDDATGNLKVGADWVLESDNVNIKGLYFDSESIEKWYYTLDTTTFQYTGSVQTYTVPADCASINVALWGADGGSGGYYSYDNNYSRGGTGGYSEGTISVTPGEILYIYVGGRGYNWFNGGNVGYNGTLNYGRPSSNTIASGGWGGATGYGNGGRATKFGMAGGGGASQIRTINNANYTDKTPILILAGGGGGGGNTDSIPPYVLSPGGDGGGTVGETEPTSTQFRSRNAGVGGGQSQGTNAAGSWSGSGDGNASAGFSQVSHNNLQGGGGGGYYGGGQNANSTGGGGGSSYIGHTRLSNANTYTGSEAVTLGLVNPASANPLTGDVDGKKHGYISITVNISTPPFTTPVPISYIYLANLKILYNNSGITNAIGHTPLTSGGLYEFSTHTFTNCGATGHIGPELTDCTSAYSSYGDYVNKPHFFNVIGESGTNGIQVWTVPDTGDYKIDAYGAKGGGTYGDPVNSEGGDGAYIQVRVSLTMGDKYMILCGQKGGAGANVGLGSSGGGGTFFVKGDDYTSVTLSDVIVVAGGGGGRGSAGHGANSGQNGFAGSSDITDGGAGGAYGCGGGGGLLDNGDGNGRDGSGPSGGYSFSNGGRGGTPGNYTNVAGQYGGFGGGGGASVHAGSGAGGIYGGNGTNPYNDNPNGKGGGSHYKGTLLYGSGGFNDDHGKLIITAVNTGGEVARQIYASDIKLSYFTNATFTTGDPVPYSSISIDNHFKGRIFAPPPLYPFTSHTFTNCGKQGRYGPSYTQCINSYGTSGNWWNNTNFFDVLDGLQKWTVPKTGDYLIDAYGAQGGKGWNSPGSNDNGISYNYRSGGFGIRYSGEFSLTEGDVIWICVGQKGMEWNDGLAGTYAHRPGAGGGGSFVVKASPVLATENDILVIAGAGGGGGQWGRGTNGGHATSATHDTSTPVAEGIPFGGGWYATGPPGEGGDPSTSYLALGHPGAGFLTDGVASPGSPYTSYVAQCPRSYVNSSGPNDWDKPLVGGRVTTWMAGQGGFGGGGGTGLGPGGGGGGYSGGDTYGTWSSSGRGYGGGSINNGTNTSYDLDHNYVPNYDGHGKVIITLLSNET